MLQVRFMGVVTSMVVSADSVDAMDVAAFVRRFTCRTVTVPRPLNASLVTANMSIVYRKNVVNCSVLGSVLASSVVRNSAEMTTRTVQVLCVSWRTFSCTISCVPRIAFVFDSSVTVVNYSGKSPFCLHVLVNSRRVESSSVNTRLNFSDSMIAYSMILWLDSILCMFVVSADSCSGW